jgi:hypothetical protein
MRNHGDAIDHLQTSHRSGTHELRAAGGDDVEHRAIARQLRLAHRIDRMQADIIERLVEADVKLGKLAA